MRYLPATLIAACVVALMLASPASAQRPAAYAIPSVPAPRDPPPHFTIAPRGAPLGPVGLPLPQIGLQPPIPVDRPGHGHRGRAFSAWPMMVFYVPQPFYGTALLEPVPGPADSRSSVAAEAPPMPGRLVLDVTPAGAQVFADGYYVGVPGDFGPERGGGIFDPGSHRLDLTAAGYEPISVDIRVGPGQVVTYRATLKPLPPPVSAPPSTFYLIPGCYMGNIPPKDARLPDTCDKNHAITWRP